MAIQIAKKKSSQNWQQSILYRPASAFAVTFIFCALFFIAPTKTDAATLQRVPNNLGLQEYWPLDEGTSTSATDYSGNGKTGTLTNSPTWTNGRHGKAVSLTAASSQYVLLPDIDANITTAATMSAWIKPNNPTAAGYKGIVGTSSGAGLMMFINGGKLYVDVKTDAGRVFVGSGGAVSVPVANVWYHVVLTYNGTTQVGYVNAVNVISSAQTGTVSQTSSGRIGYSGFSTEYFDGAIDDVRIYNRALSAAEVATLYANGSATRKVLTKNGLLAQWTFDEATSTTAGDISGNGNTMILAGPTWTAGRKGKALLFDGLDSRVSTTSITYLNKSGSLSLSAWIKVGSVGSNYTITIRGNTNAIVPWAWFYYAGSSNTLRLWNANGNSASVSNAISIEDSKWHHVTVSAPTGGAIAFYVDGVDVTAVGNATYSETASTLTSYPFEVGARTHTSGIIEDFVGSIDDVRVYNRALTFDEVRSIYNEVPAVVNTSQNTRITEGLVGMWSFNGADITDKVYDRSGYNSFGYIVNTATSTAKGIGKVGQAIVLDGTNDYITIGTPSVLQATNVSVSAWAKTSDAKTVQFIGGYGDTSTNGYWLGASTGSGTFVFSVGNSVTIKELSSGVVAADGLWHHVVGTYDGVTTNIYIDGVLKATDGTVTGNLAGYGSLTDGFLIGQAQGHTAARYWNGGIDEFRVYNRALTAAEVKSLYLMGK